MLSPQAGIVVGIGIGTTAFLPCPVPEYLNGSFEMHSGTETTYSVPNNFGSERRITRSAFDRRIFPCWRRSMERLESKQSWCARGSGYSLEHTTLSSSADGSPALRKTDPISFPLPPPFANNTDYKGEIIAQWLVRSRIKRSWIDSSIG